MHLTAVGIYGINKIDLGGVNNKYPYLVNIEQHIPNNVLPQKLGRGDTPIEIPVPLTSIPPTLTKDTKHAHVYFEDSLGKKFRTKKIKCLLDKTEFKRSMY